MKNTGLFQWGLNTIGAKEKGMGTFALNLLVLRCLPRAWKSTDPHERAPYLVS